MPPRRIREDLVGLVLGIQLPNITARFLVLDTTQASVGQHQILPVPRVRLLQPNSHRCFPRRTGDIPGPVLAHPTSPRALALEFPHQPLFNAEQCLDKQRRGSAIGEGPAGTEGLCQLIRVGPTTTPTLVLSIGFQILASRLTLIATLGQPVTHIPLLRIQTSIALEPSGGLFFCHRVGSHTTFARFLLV